MTQRSRKPASTVDSTVAGAVKSGDRLRALHAIRDKLAADLDTADAKTSPALAQRLIAVMAEIEAQSGPAEVSNVDRIRNDLEAQRAKRRASAGS